MRPPLRVRDVSDGYVPLVSDGPDCPRCRLPWALHPTRDGEPWCRDFYARGASVPAWARGLVSCESLRTTPAYTLNRLRRPANGSARVLNT